MQKVSPGANVFSWQFCTRTSRSRQLNRYGWRAMGLQRWVGWGGVWLEPVSQKTPHPPLLAPPLDLAGKCEGLRLRALVQCKTGSYDAVRAKISSGPAAPSPAARVGK